MTPMTPIARTDPDARLARTLGKEFFLLAGAPGTPLNGVRGWLSRQPGIRLGGEGRFTDAFAVPLKDLLADYNRAQAADDPGAAFTQADFRVLMRTAIGLSLARLPGAETAAMLGTTVTVHAHNLDFLDLLFPAMKVLHVVCDGRTLAAGAATGEAEAAAHIWADAVGTACRFGASRPERYHEVRLEDLAATDAAPHRAAALRFLLGDDATDAAPEGLTPDGLTPDGPAAVTDPGAPAMARMAPLLRQFGYRD